MGISHEGESGRPLWTPAANGRPPGRMARRCSVATSPIANRSNYRPNGPWGAGAHPLEWAGGWVAAVWGNRGPVAAGRAALPIFINSYPLSWGKWLGKNSGSSYCSRISIQCVFVVNFMMEDDDGRAQIKCPTSSPPVPPPLPSILATKTRSTSVTSQLNPPPFLNAYLRRPCGFLILMNPHLLVLNSIRPFGSDDVVIGGPMPWLLPCCHVAMLPLTVWWLWMIKAVSISITSQ